MNITSWSKEFFSPHRRTYSIGLMVIVLALLMAVNAFEMIGRHELRSHTGSLEVKLYIRALFFLGGIVIWCSLAKALTNNDDRRISWWQLLELYLVSCLIISPHAILDGWSTLYRGSTFLWSPIYDKIVQLIIFWVWTVKLAHANNITSYAKKERPCDT